MIQNASTSRLGSSLAIPRTHAIPLIAALGALAAAGCSAEAPSADNTGDVAPTGGAHAMPLRDRGDETAVPAPIAPPGAHLTYYGGKVIQNVHVTQVLYGTGTYLPELTSIAGVNMASAYIQMVTSGVFDWLSEYNTASPAQAIGRGSFGGSLQIAPAASHNGATITDADIQAEIAAQIGSGALPAPDDNQLYMAHFPVGKTITLGTESSCVAGGFCAYHGTFKIGAQNVYYGVLPALTGACATGCGFAPTAFQNQTSVASHELVEAITDAEVGLATGIGPPLAWYDQNFGEIGDICNAQQGPFTGTDGVTYTIQQEFSNQQNSCFTTPMNLFRLVSVQSRKVHGSMGTFDLPINISGTQPVTVEPRAIGAGFTLIFHFTNSVTSVGSLLAVDANGAAIGTGTVSLSGGDAIVNLTGIPENQRVVVTLGSVNSLFFDVSVTLGFLVGDTNNSLAVDTTDVDDVKARSGQATDASNFKYDVNANGAINSSDISAVKARVGRILP
jgi:hypothetical protein